jgi:hypothetical protein
MVEKKPPVRRQRQPVAKTGTATARKRAPGPKAAERLPADVDRQALVRTAAYYRAQQRGFAPGRELEDWFAAEAEVAALTARAPAGKPRARGRKPAG